MSASLIGADSWVPTRLPANAQRASSLRNAVSACAHASAVALPHLSSVKLCGPLPIRLIWSKKRVTTMFIRIGLAWRRGEAMLENEEPIVNKFTQLVQHFLHWFRAYFTLRRNIFPLGGTPLSLNQSWILV